MKEFNTTFKDSELHVWTVKITTRIALAFAGQNNLRIEEMIPDYLNAEQLVRLTWAGIQHHADAKHLSYEGFLDMLEGEALDRAMRAGSMALINFTLARHPEKKREILRARVEKRLAEEEKKAQGEDGNSTTTVE